MHSNNPSAIEKSVAVSYINGYAFLFEVAGIAVLFRYKRVDKQINRMCRVTYIISNLTLYSPDFSRALTFFLLRIFSLIFEFSEILSAFHTVSSCLSG